jgi:hypothetical protein
VLRANLHRFPQVITAQFALFAAYNHLHIANQRLARWLLMSQKFLPHMLGMRRTSVTAALGCLEKNWFDCMQASSGDD